MNTQNDKIFKTQDRKHISYKKNIKIIKLRIFKFENIRKINITYCILHSKQEDWKWTHSIEQVSERSLKEGEK